MMDHFDATGAMPAYWDCTCTPSASHLLLQCRDQRRSDRLTEPARRSLLLSSEALPVSLTYCDQQVASTGDALARQRR